MSNKYGTAYAAFKQIQHQNYTNKHYKPEFTLN